MGGIFIIWEISGDITGSSYQSEQSNEPPNLAEYNNRISVRGTPTKSLLVPGKTNATAKKVVLCIVGQTCNNNNCVMPTVT